MANRIAGITIEIGGDTTNLQKSLKSVDSQLKTTQNSLKDINKLLKLDPSNTELLVQKQKNLENAISLTKTRLNELKNAQSGVKEGSEEWDRLQREIIETEQNLKTLEQDLRNFGSVTAQQIKAAGQSMTEFGDKVSAAGQKFQPLSTAAAGALTALGGLAYKSVQTADELNTLSQQTGLSTTEIQKLQYAADFVDVSFDDMRGALAKVKKQMTGAPDLWAQLGISVTNADGSMRDATDVFYESLEALSKIENETERDQVAMSLFGKSADNLAGIIDDGGKSLKAYGQEAEDLGVILGEDTVNDLNAVNDTIDKLKKQGGGALAELGATMAKTLAPVLDKVIELIGNVTERIKKLTPEQAETIVKILGVVAAIGPLLTIGGKLISMVGSITSVIGAVVGVLGGPLTLAIGAVIAIGVLLYKNWDEIKAAAIQLKDNLVKTWDNIKASVSTSIDNLKTKFNDFRDSASAIWNGFMQNISNVIDNVKGKIDAFKQKFEDLRSSVEWVIQRIKDAFNFSWSFPSIKLPHISIGYNSTGWLGQLFGIDYIPTFSIQWYKKAYENAVMFNSPTVLATPNGLKGFGDGHGAEIVMGLDKLRELVGEQDQNVTINVYGSQGQNVEQLADEIARRFVAQNKMRKAAGLI